MIDELKNEKWELERKYNWDVREVYLEALNGSEVIDVHVKNGEMIAIVFMKGKRKMKIETHHQYVELLEIKND